MAPPRSSTDSRAGGSRPPAWVRNLTRSDLRDLFGETTLKRGLAYQRRGNVLSLGTDPDGTTISATVRGTHRYSTFVRPIQGLVSPQPAGYVEIGTLCSCPLGGECKHAVAVILEAQNLLDAAQPARTASGWERILAPVVRDSTAPGPSPQHVPLALLIDVVPASGRYQTHAHLRLRPLQPGASGAWVRTGISWSDVQYSYQWQAFDPAQQEALAAIAATDQSNTQYHYGSNQWIPAARLGTRLWGLLDAALAAGVAVVTGAKGQLPVTVLPEAADVVLDARRDAPEADIVLRPQLRVPGVEGEPVPMGNPADGVFIAQQDGLTLARLVRPLGPHLARLLEVDSLTIPARDETRFLTRYYPALRQAATVESTDGSVTFPEVQPPRLALQVNCEPDHTTRLRWTFRYAVGSEVTDVPLLREATQEPLARDAAAEEALLASLAFLDTCSGLTTPLPGKARPGIVVEPTLQGWSTAVFVQEILPVLQARSDIDVSVVGSPLEYAQWDGPPTVTVATHDIGSPEATDRSDWFDLDIQVTAGGREIPLVTLLSSMARGDRRLILDDGTWFSLDQPELHTLRRIVEEARALHDHESGGLRINRYQASLWEDLVALGVVAQQSRRWEESVGALLALEDLPRPDPPAGLAATLRPYQLDGYRWLSFLWDHGMGGILADDMGLGKTLQTLATAERARVAGSLTPEQPMLVVAPTSVVATWHREAATFTPELSVATITQTTRKSGNPLADAVAGAHVVVTSYALFRLDAEQYGDLTWSALVLDEAQFVKNHRARTYQVARTLSAPVKIAITGTPLENSLMDLWALLSITAPGLFPSPDRFGDMFRKPIESGGSPELLATLRRRIRPLMLRRTKEAVADDLPPKIEQVLRVPLNTAHRRIYDTHLQRERQRVLGLLDDVDRNRVAILAALTQLRQLSLDVHLVVPDAPATVHSSKVEALIEQLVEVIAEGHRCLVFSQFTRFLKIVRQRLDAEGIRYVYLDGRTRDRPKRIAEFTDGDAPVFLISLKAGGSGLTLTEADYVFVLDPWWNPAVEAQAIDRTHRIGQDKTVMVYRLVSENTIEEKVVALQERKRELFSKVIDEGGLMGAPMTAEDIRGLFEG